MMPPMPSLSIRSHQCQEMIDLTEQVQETVSHAGVNRGTVYVYVPHTTAGITINECSDPDVVHDMLKQLDVIVPAKQSFYRHAEGNSAAHLKASIMGSSVTVVIHNGLLLLGRWQGIWFCEFDGPRGRKVIVRVRSDQTGAPRKPPRHKA